MCAQVITTASSAPRSTATVHELIDDSQRSAEGLRQQRQELEAGHELRKRAELTADTGGEQQLQYQLNHVSDIIIVVVVIIIIQSKS